ncbi:alpha/beta hydrolase [Aureliella helgolandensis]|uniref:Carboxylesterase NlhH n=1 Tax=Aureliella helgolandensis TaxID=2527968 RepID=A0A518G2Y6_9BACT|nr:alpha/beta hydrolase [Aureliella helgolandensis]QDV22958.1 Carboxylesterase NlhH [Aureliella helgolandensis]
MRYSLWAAITLWSGFSVLAQAQTQPPPTASEEAVESASEALSVLDQATSAKSVASEIEVKVQRDIKFAEVNGQSLLLDVYVPQNVASPPPLIVWIHGGGWRGGSKAKPPIRRVTECGYALASISYRFSDQAIFPAQLHDCKGAIRWLRAHQKNYGYNAEWIGVAGSSAGGYLAVFLGVAAGDVALEGEVGGNLQESSRVQAVVDYFGPTDFVLRGATQPEVAYSEKAGSFALLGGLKRGKIDPQLERAASAAYYVEPTAPPILVFHGENDKLVLPSQSERIVEAYQAAGVPAELVRVAGAGHGGAKFFWGENFEKTLNFLDQQRPKRDTQTDK